MNAQILVFHNLVVLKVLFGLLLAVSDVSPKISWGEKNMLSLLYVSSKSI